MHPAKTQAAQPTQKRTGGQSRRSCTRQDKRANARRRPSTHPKPKRRSRPKCAPAAKPPQQRTAGQTHQRKTKGLNNCVRQDKSTHARHRAQTTRTRQRRAAQAAQTAVGDAQLRILLRDDHVQSLRQHKVPPHQQKRFSLWGSGDISFWQAQKEMPPKKQLTMVKTKPKRSEST